MRLQIRAEHPEPRKIRQAVGVLQKGGIVAYPTDSVYGIGCDLREKKAIERLHRVRHLPMQKPLTLLCGDLSNVASFALVDKPAYRLMKRLAPGPFCFVLPATRTTPKALLTKQKTVGIRVPEHPVVSALLAELDGPLVSTSARFQGDTLVDPDEIDRRLSGIDLVLDVEVGGSEPSTIIDLSGDEPVVLRQGAGVVTL